MQPHTSFVPVPKAMSYASFRCGCPGMSCCCTDTIFAWPNSTSAFTGEQDTIYDATYTNNNDIYLFHNPEVPPHDPHCRWLESQRASNTLPPETLNSLQTPDFPFSIDYPPNQAPKRNSTASAATTTIERSYPCRRCIKTFTNQRNRRRHERDQHFDGVGEKFECPVSTCKGLVGRKDNLDKHMAFVHLECSKCREKFENGDDVMEHRKVEHKVVRRRGKRANTM